MERLGTSISLKKKRKWKEEEGDKENMMNEGNYAGDAPTKFEGQQTTALQKEHARQPRKR